MGTNETVFQCSGPRALLRPHTACSGSWRGKREVCDAESWESGTSPGRSNPILYARNSHTVRRSSYIHFICCIFCASERWVSQALMSTDLPTSYPIPSPKSGTHIEPCAAGHCIAAHDPKVHAPNEFWCLSCLSAYERTRTQPSEMQPMQCLAKFTSPCTPPPTTMECSKLLSILG